MHNSGTWLMIVGGLMLFAAIILYWRDASRKTLFPVILVVGGIFLCAAQTVKAKLPGVDLEFSRAIVDASDKNEKMLLAQNEALKALADDLKELRQAFTAYQSSVNDRFSALDAKPVAVTDEAAIAASAANLDAKLSAVRNARAPVERANEDLRRITKSIF